MEMDVDVVIYELYGLPIDQFTAARDTQAKNISTFGDKETAARVRRLRKPSQAAWLMNTLVRRHPEEIEKVLELGEDLRRAQSDARGDDLRVLSSARQALVQRVLQLVSEEAKAGGTPLGTHTQRQLTATLEAAIANEASGLALATGRLTEAMSHVGFGGVPATDRTGLKRRPERDDGRDGTSETPQRARRTDALDEAHKRLVDAQTAMDAATVTLDETRASRIGSGQVPRGR